MTSKREQVVLAVLALVRSAVPNAKVLRNSVKPQTIPDDGYINVQDGDSGQPEIDLSPLTYIYEHNIMVSVSANPSGTTKAEANIDALLHPIGLAVAANRTLGGLCDFVMVSAPSMLPIDATGAVASRQADIEITAIYATTDPLN